MGKRVSLWLPDDLLQMVELAAEIEDRSRNEFIVRALEDVLKPMDVPKLGEPARRAISATSLFELRRAHGLNLRRAAEALECTVMTLQSVEKGRSYPRPDLIDRMAATYQVPKETIQRILENPGE